MSSKEEEDDLSSFHATSSAGDTILKGTYPD